MRSKRVEWIFAERVTRWSSGAAIKVGDREVSYAELERISNRLARRLIRDGVVRNDIVGIATSDIEYFAIGVLAVLKAGAAYLAVDTRYPVDRVRDILADAVPAILLADTEFPASLIPAGVQVIRDFAEDSALNGFSGEAVAAVGSVDDAACIYYTSGSTGGPKGVEVAHRGFPSLVGDADFVPFGQDDRVGQTSNLAFDGITFELWGALLHGGCIVQIPKQAIFSAPVLKDFLERERITVLWLTTSLFNALAASQPTAFERLQVLVIGGEAADDRAIGRVLRSGKPPRRLINAYGPTEATTFASWYEVTLADVEAGRVPIGRAIRDTKLYILDNAMRLVQPGEPGELFIGGPGVANGYLRQQGFTKERFVAGPSGADAPDRLYRTGDLCRELADGNIEYLGRIDGQVKIRGFRVEPSEVAATLRRLSGVDDAVVLVREVSFGTKELVAFVRGANLPSGEYLRREMAGIVPDYMVPSIIRGIGAFPLTANGKLDSGALLAKIPSGSPESETAKGGDLGIDDLDRRIAAIWKYILRRDDVPFDRDFWILGGDSLSTMNLALEIESAFGVVLSIDDLASPLTIASLAAQLRARLGDNYPGIAVAKGEIEASPKVFAISYPWIMGRMPDEIGQAFGAAQLRHVQLPFTYFRTEEAITIENMAVHIENLICSLAPDGPYVLYGHCFTGMLAYEVAQRLSAAGHAVSVVIVDSYPSATRSWPRWAKSQMRHALSFAKSDLKAKMLKLRRKLRPAPAARYEDFIKDACFRAARLYRPRPYDGRVVFFRNSDDGALIDQDPTVWRRVARGRYIEHAIDFHDQGRITAESVQSSNRAIAAKLKEMNFAA